MLALYINRIYNATVRNLQYIYLKRVYSKICRKWRVSMKDKITLLIADDNQDFSKTLLDIWKSKKIWRL